MREGRDLAGSLSQRRDLQLLKRSPKVTVRSFRRLNVDTQRSPGHTRSQLKIIGRTSAKPLITNAPIPLNVCSGFHQWVPNYPHRAVHLCSGVHNFRKSFLCKISGIVATRAAEATWYIVCLLPPTDDTQSGVPP